MTAIITLSDLPVLADAMLTSFSPEECFKHLRQNICTWRVITYAVEPADGGNKYIEDIIEITGLWDKVSRRACRIYDCSLRRGNGCFELPGGKLRIVRWEIAGDDTGEVQTLRESLRAKVPRIARGHEKNEERGAVIRERANQIKALTADLTPGERRSVLIEAGLLETYI